MFKRFSICYILFMFCITGTSAQEDRWTGNATNLSKGNLRVNSSGRYLEYSDGTPFLYMGDTAWELISRLNDKETKLYLENRREKGFTVIQTVILDELDDMDVSSNGEPKLIDGNIDNRFRRGEALLLRLIHQADNIARQALLAADKADAHAARRILLFPLLRLKEIFT